MSLPTSKPINRSSPPPQDIPDGKVGIPRVYLFDSKGRQVYTSYGFQPSEAPALEARVKQAMAK